MESPATEKSAHPGRAASLASNAGLHLLVPGTQAQSLS